MDTVKNLAALYVAPKLMKNFKWRWLAYGVAAYYGLKLLKSQGLLPKAAEPVVDFVDHKIAQAKDSVIGMTSTHSLPAERSLVGNSENAIH